MGFNLEDYEPVASRLDRFLKAHPDARVITDLVHYLSDVAVFKCELWLNDEIIATGWAEEIRGQGNVNKTSHVENCETSALGRALSNAGLVCKSMGKVPPHNLQSFSKREASAYIDSLKNGEQPAPTYDTPEEPF